MRDDVPGIATFMSRLEISGRDVVDGVGDRGFLKGNLEEGVRFEGGVLSMQGDVLVRTGKSGTRMLYVRVASE